MKDRPEFSDELELDLIGERLATVEQRAKEVLKDLGIKKSVFLLGSKELESWEQMVTDRDRLKAKAVSTLLALTRMVRVKLDSGKYLGALRHCAEALATSDILLDAELGSHQRSISSERGRRPKRRVGIWTAIKELLRRYQRAGAELPTARTLWELFEAEYPRNRSYECDVEDQSFWVFSDGDRITQERLVDKSKSSIGYSTFKRYHLEVRKSLLQVK